MRIIPERKKYRAISEPTEFLTLELKLILEIHGYME
jgi:hypothetical protein